MSTSIDYVRMIKDIVKYMDLVKLWGRNPDPLPEFPSWVKDDWDKDLHQMELESGVSELVY